MSTIIVSFLNFIDRDHYATYAAMAGKILMRDGVKIIVNDENPTVVAGDDSIDKVVVLEFRDDDHMMAVLGSDEYKAAMVYREKAIKMRSVKVDRFEMPS
ncbi:hypothetical protein GCM10009069_26410 [Algimonas arctica]|uniref:DUF1330 domain-containing protein n=1 Tax=Algimonas arctica TaxID=1479486 RepID=A0A8J3CT62_9PROT|nr:DUF1330 domain-containing protein [Algimonas arctica]GHB02401.1 hypothetical protein GCM10009069_26410 [Algimonas arctica]